MANTELADPSAELWALPDAMRSMVEAELEEGERIAWLGQPNPRRFALRALPIVLFGIPWTAFAIFWISAAAGFKPPKFQNGEDLFPLFGIPFVLIGVGMLTSPLWAVRIAQRTVYLVTNRRAILFEGGFSTSVRSFGPESLKTLERRQRRDGSGDLIFDRQFRMNSQGNLTPRTGAMTAIPDVRNVERLLRSLWEPAADR